MLFFYDQQRRPAQSILWHFLGGQWFSRVWPLGQEHQHHWGIFKKRTLHLWKRGFCRWGPAPRAPLREAGAESHCAVGRWCSFSLISRPYVIMPFFPTNYKKSIFPYDLSTYLYLPTGSLEWVEQYFDVLITYLDQNYVFSHFENYTPMPTSKETH